MSVTLCSPVCGLDVDDIYDGELEDWLVAEGYAVRDGQDEAPVATLDAELDPTVAANREAPGDEAAYLGDKLAFDVKAPVETGQRKPAKPDVTAVPLIGEDEGKAPATPEGAVTTATPEAPTGDQGAQETPAA